MKLIWTDPAEKDLWDILDFIADDNPDAAWEMRSLLHNSADSLLQFPNKGRPGRVIGTRELVVMPSYILIYKIDNSYIRILRVLHMSQNYPSS